MTRWTCEVCRLEFRWACRTREGWIVQNLGISENTLSETIASNGVNRRQSRYIIEMAGETPEK